MVITSLCRYVNPKQSFIPLAVISAVSIVHFFLTCCFELSIFFLLYGTSFIIRLWLREPIMIYYHTVIWCGTLIWFFWDKRKQNIYTARTVDEVEDEGLDTIELT